MTNLINRLFQNAMPFLLIGTMIALGFVLFIFIAHIVLWGSLIAVVLYIGYTIRNHFFPPPKKQNNNTGRIIDHDDV